MLVGYRLSLANRVSSSLPLLRQQQNQDSGINGTVLFDLSAADRLALDNTRLEADLTNQDTANRALRLAGLIRHLNRSAVTLHARDAFGNEVYLRFDHPEATDTEKVKALNAGQEVNSLTSFLTQELDKSEAQARTYLAALGRDSNNIGQVVETDVEIGLLPRTQAALQFEQIHGGLSANAMLHVGLGMFSILAATQEAGTELYYQDIDGVKEIVPYLAANRPARL
jgi:hypothetical protein